MDGKGLLGAVSLAVVGGYLFHLSFDSWWYLRFLLPCWPPMCLSVSRLLARPSGDGFGFASKIVLASVGIYGLWFAHEASAFEFGRSEQRYVQIAKLVEQETEPNSVILTLQHSGSLRYYAGRTTVRFDGLHEDWLDRTIAWLRNEGLHPYVLLDDWEHALFEKRFSRSSAFGRLDMSKVFQYRDGTATTLYDPLKPAIASEGYRTVWAPRGRDLAAGCIGPAPVPPFLR